MFHAIVQFIDSIRPVRVFCLYLSICQHLHIDKLTNNEHFLKLIARANLRNLKLIVHFMV